MVDLHDCDRERARDHVILDGMEDAQRHSCKWDWPNGIGNKQHAGQSGPTRNAGSRMPARIHYPLPLPWHAKYYTTQFACCVGQTVIMYKLQGRT